MRDKLLEGAIHMGRAEDLTPRWVLRQVLHGGDRQAHDVDIADLKAREERKVAARVEQRSLGHKRVRVYSV